MPSVLIIEDTEDMREMMRTFIGRMPDYEIYEAEDGLQGIKMAEQLKPTLIILDLMMPVATGDFTLGYLRSTPHLKQIPVIVTSAHPNAHNIAAQLGANACLVKPFRITELQHLITELTPAVPKPT